jgi:hypothetical protein
MPNGLKYDLNNQTFNNIMKTAVVTIVIGEDYIRKYNETFRTSTEMYCARHGYEFIMVTSSLLPKEYTSK